MKKVCLVILDGWGINKVNTEYNSILNSENKIYNNILKEYPHTKLNASGLFVGLPDGQMGNSEVGHLNMGGGRVVYQDLTRIDKEIADGVFRENKVLRETMKIVKESGKTLHLCGLLSDGGVHSHIRHLKGLLEVAKEFEIPKVSIHGILDGRDVAPTSSLKYIKEILDFIKDIGVGELSSLCGRYYTMDRDNRWNRVKLGYDLMVFGEGIKSDDPLKAVKEQYEDGITDEFIKPISILNNGKSSEIQDGDSFILFNYRGDRGREISKALISKDFLEFPRKNIELNYVTFTDYDKSLHLNVMYTHDKLKNTLGEYVSSLGLKQLRIAETEKYAHVTFFFNGGVEKENPGEDRILIPSPKVATYDLQPEMSLPEVSSKLVQAIKDKKYDLIICNFANGDMVGHTGIYDAAKSAVGYLDEALGRVKDAVLKSGGVLMITADHGNCEEMYNYKENKPHTAHTTNLVPFILIDGTGDIKKLKEFNGELALKDIAPTIIECLDIKKPKEMTGNSLIEK